MKEEALRACDQPRMKSRREAWSIEEDRFGDDRVLI